MSMYPERRPYATALPHAGYAAKPLLPPVEALRILNSAVGMDVPRSLRRRASTRAGDKDKDKDKSLPSANGRLGGMQVWKPATLESATPFEFKEKDYHNSQQVALNAQLSLAVEELFKVWHRKVKDLLHYLESYPAQCASSNTLTAAAMDSFFKGYRTTDVMPMTAEQLAQDFKLGATPNILDAIQSNPTLQTDRIRRTLDTLLNANHFLAPLENYVQELEPLAALALHDESHEEDKDGMIRGVVWLSKAAVALHEKFHYNPSEYALKELRKSDLPIERLERRVLETKEHKEHAIDEEKPGDALTLLTTQVDLSNDLLLMNKARLELVKLHSNDVKELKPLIETIIADARRTVELLKGRIDHDLPLVQKDLESLRQDTQNTGDHIKYLQKEDQEANAAARKAFNKIEDEEKDLWALLLQTMQKLVKISETKDDFVKKQMRFREQRARDMALAMELLKAQQQYYDRLRVCEESLWRWGDAAEVYGTYVEAYVPKLLKKVHDAEEADQILYNREAQDYVRRYEMFEYAVEEGRATRQVHVDRLKVLLRSKMLDVERAVATLDPHLDKYKRVMSEAQEQLDETQAYVDLMLNLERERRSEVEPILQHVISYNRTMQSQNITMDSTTQALQLRDRPQTARSGPRVMESSTKTEESHKLYPTEDGINKNKDMEVKDGIAIKEEENTTARGADGEPIVAETDIIMNTTEVTGFASAPPLTGALKLRTMTTNTNSTGIENPMMATVAHPHVQARTIGIHHEEAFLEKYRRFTDDEQRAVEGSAAKIRKTRHELDKIGIKYDNADYVRMLLGAPERSV